jgi:hypothetical protein
MHFNCLVQFDIRKHNILCHNKVHIICTYNLVGCRYMCVCVCVCVYIYIYEISERLRIFLFGVVCGQVVALL